MSARQNKSLRSPLVPVLLAFALVAVHALAEDVDTTLSQRLLGAVLGVGALVGAWRFWRYQLYHRLPVPEIALAQLYIFLGAPTVTDSLQRGPRVSSAGVTTALEACVLFAFVGVGAAMVGVRFVKLIKPRLARLFPERLAPGGKLVLPFWALLVAVANTSIVWLLPISLRFPAAIAADSAGLLLYVATRDQSDERKATRELLMAAAFIGAVGLISGMLEQVLRPLALAALLVLLIYRRVPVRWLVAGAVLFAILNPAKHIFRQEHDWASFDKERLEMTKEQLLVNPADAAESWVDAIESSWFGDGNQDRNTARTVDRLNYLSSVARTVDWAGKRVPFDEGTRWWLIPRSLLPRAIDPEKPLMTREVNDRYNYLFRLQTAHGSRRSTVALPIIADGYWNFGWFGVVFVGMVAGFYWGATAALWDAKHFGISWLALALFIRSGVAPSLYEYSAGVPKVFVGIAAMSWALALLSRTIASQPAEGSMPAR